MLGRGLGEARRRIVLICLIAFFLILTLVGFRRQDTIKDVVSNGLHRTTDATAPVAMSDTKTDLKEDVSKPDPPKSEKTQTKPSTPPPSMKGPVLGNGERSLASESLQDIHNSSLGFGKVFVLNVPARSDKLDAMKLTSSLTGFDFDIIEGTNGKDVPKKALSGVSAIFIR
ncbi:hypothetical protein OEA41_007329 [Lepraria neglecta]|uniref:Uncharacterized protein n=1 Tax=Lepraria neglecta TaxID=209136 RepID=A0AAE0DN56_9LECA|nr:hypothetical protein OEA41_007329 [Lepraria neglecta]